MSREAELLAGLRAAAPAYHRRVRAAQTEMRRAARALAKLRPLPFVGVPLADCVDSPRTLAFDGLAFVVQGAAEETLEFDACACNTQLAARAVLPDLLFEILRDMKEPNHAD